MIMGSDSDLKTMKAAADVLEDFGIPTEVTIVSAHRTPERMMDFAKTAHQRGIKLIIAGAGKKSNSESIGIISYLYRWCCTSSRNGCCFDATTSDWSSLCTRWKSHRWNGRSPVHRPDAKRCPCRNSRHWKCS